MLRQLPLEDLGYVDFSPQAVIRVPIAFFATKLGYKFDSCTDDLDEYQSAFFKLEDVMPFGLIHYKGHPDDTTIIYFSRATPLELVANVVAQILDDFGLRLNNISWLSSGLPEGGLAPHHLRPVRRGTTKNANTG
jgi:hypothetical protein